MLSSLTSKEVTSKDDARSTAIVLPTMPAPSTAIFISPFFLNLRAAKMRKKVSEVQMGLKRFEKCGAQTLEFLELVSFLNNLKGVVTFSVFSRFRRYQC